MTRRQVPGQQVGEVRPLALSDPREFTPPGCLL